MKKRILAFILIFVMLFLVAPTTFATGSSQEYVPDSGSILALDTETDMLNISKKVDPGTGSDYMLTLDAYTTMEISGKVTDLVLVLDQSGSMFHAADVDSNVKSFQLQNGSTIKTYINNSLTFNQMETQAAEDISNGKNGPEMTGYYMARISNKLYALRRDSNGNWYRTGSTYPGTSGSGDDEIKSAQEGKVATYSEYADTLLTDDNKNKAQCYKSIYGVTYDALQAFLNEIKGTPNLRVAVVGFAGGDDRDWAGTGMYLDGQWLTYGEEFKYDNIDTGDYFKETWDTEEMNSLEASIDAFWPRHNQTYTKAGFNIASELFERDGGDEDESQKNHIVLLFSDGEPTGDGSPTSVVNNLKTGKSKDGKYETGYITEIYTVGPVCKHSDVNALEAWATNKNHYFAPTIENMNTAFEQIASSIIETTLTLDKTAYLYDEISPSFQLPQELLNAYNEATTDTEKEVVLKNNINVYTAEAVFNGNTVSFNNKVPFSDAKLTMNAEKTGIQVANFDYSSNYVTMYAYEHPETGNKDYHGCKLIVEIPIDVKPDFLGGDNVYTNSTDSGIFYASGDAVKYYTSPNVDITVSTITPHCTPKDIYLSQQASIPEVIKLGEYYQNDGSWKVDGINNAYVDIVYIITDEDGNSMTYTIPAGTTYAALTDIGWSEDAETHPLLKEDTVYTVKCTVTSVNNNSNTKTDQNDAVIQVYKPEITFQDSLLLKEYTENYPGNLASIVWKHSEGENIEVAPSEMGEAPTLEYSFSPEAGPFTKDTPVQVTSVTAIKDGNKVPIDQEIIEYVTFYRKGKACSYSECDWEREDEEIVLVDKTDGDANFVIHAPTKALTITKNVTGNMADLNKEFEFIIDLSKSFKKISDDSETTTKIKLDVTDFTTTGDTTVEKNGTNGVYKFKLKDNQSVVFNVPYGTDYKITETRDSSQGYETSIAVKTDDSEDEIIYESKEIGNSVINDTSIIYTNNRDVEVDTGVDTSTPFHPIAMLLFVIATTMIGGKIYLEKQRSLHRIRR